jgi:acetate kinase
VRILCFDVGSSSLRFAVYRVSEGRLQEILTGEATGLGQPPGRFRVRAGSRQRADVVVPEAERWDLESALVRVWRALDDDPVQGGLSAAGHRIVFGGPKYVAPVIAGEDVLRSLEECAPLDPIHVRAQLDAVHAVGRRFPALPQVLCFDTAFHRVMPALAKLLPVPRRLDPILERYGFHGLSYEYVLWKLGPQAKARTIIAHLGNGASLTAVHNGRPVDTTMGFSPLGGLVMGSRPGDIDPGVLLYLLNHGYDAAALTDLLYRQCGMLGVSQITASMEELLPLAGTDARARQAVDLFIYQLVKHLGAMIAVLGGLDMLVFTGGIGEHAGSIRWRACSALSYVGLIVNEEANARGAEIISQPDSRVDVRVMRTDENYMIARHTAETIQAHAGSTRPG